MEQRPIIERIHYILESTGNTINSLALKSELDPSNLNKMLDGKQRISDKTIKKITDSFGISLDWLRNGTGRMLVGDQTVVSDSNTGTQTNGNRNINDMPNNYRGCGDAEQALYTVPLLPISAQGGALNEFVASVKDSDCERIISPISGVDFAITVSGDSMAPEYPSGSQILIKRINERAFIDWGKTYVLDTCNGTVIKNLYPSENKGKVTCKSINPSYPSFDISLTDIYGIYRVLMCMSVK